MFGQFGQPEQPGNSKYYNSYINKYDLSTENRFDFTPGMLGDATIEITNINYKINQDSNDFGTWFNSHANFINSSTLIFSKEHTNIALCSLSTMLNFSAKGFVGLLESKSCTPIFSATSRLKEILSR